MPITTNEGGVLYELDTVTANEGGTLYELDTVHSNESGTLFEIHSGWKQPDLYWYGASSQSDNGHTVTFTQYGNEKMARLDSNINSYLYSDAAISLYTTNNPYKIHLESGTKITVKVIDIGNLPNRKIKLGLHTIPEASPRRVCAVEGTIGATNTITVDTGDYIMSLGASCYISTPAGSIYQSVTATVEITFEK